MTDHEARDLLLHRASYGEITPDEAEAEAKRQGLEPFARQPDPADFDPTNELQWTLPMAVAWIADRRIDAVRNAWPAYCAECWYWFWSRWRNGPDGAIHEGWSLRQRSFPTLPHVELMTLVGRGQADDPPPLLASMKDAREALWAALGEGMLTASGVPRRGGGRVAIPAQEWLALKPLDREHRDEVGRDGVGLDYADPLVPSKAVRHLWGPRRETMELPPLMPPDGDGYMPLGCAAQWIATEGGRLGFDPQDQSVWRAAFDQLLGAIASEKVRVVGLRSGLREPLAGFRFAGCVVDYPFSAPSIELILGETIYLRCYPYIDDEHWRKGFDDALISRHKDHWTQLMVEKGDVRHRWPFARIEPPKSGAPGRPSSMYLVLAELERRAEIGNLEATRSGQAQVLADWFAGQSLDQPPLKPKTIFNKIGSRFRALRTARN